MRRTLLVTAFIMLLTLLLLSGCGGKQSAAIELSTPQDGSTVASLTPTLTWGGSAGAIYRLVVASDSNFQEVVLDAHNLIEDVYVIPSDLLEENTQYQWKVLAVSTKVGSVWSDPWMFSTPGDLPEGSGNIRVSAKLDGEAWSGALSYMISGPFSDTDNSVPWDFEDIAAGSYTLTYKGGGPAGAVLTGISPSPNQTLKAGGAMTYTISFTSQQKGSVNVNATINGEAWDGDLNYFLYGPYVESVSRVPRSFSNSPSGEYSVEFIGLPDPMPSN